jgi:hypothetical protein
MVVVQMACDRVPTPQRIYIPTGPVARRDLEEDLEETHLD